MQRSSRLLLILILLVAAAAGPSLAQEEGPAPPRVLSVSPNPVAAGGVVRIEGQGFGSAETGLIVLGGHLVPPQQVQSWSDSVVEVRLPADARPGGLSIRVGNLASESVWLHVQGAGPAAKVEPSPAVPPAAPAPRAPAPSAPAPAPAAPTPARTGGSQPSGLFGGAEGGVGLPVPRPGSGRGQEETGVVAGKVQDTDGKRLSQATIEMDGSPRGRTNGRGEFRIAGVPDGRHSISISLSGYRTAKGQVNVQAGQSKDILVSLSPTSSSSSAARPPAPEERKTKLTIRAYPYRYDEDKFNVKHIEVTEQGGAGRFWQNTFYRTYDSYVELPIDGAVIGRSYRVSVTWYSFRSKREYTSSWEPKVYREYQVESYSNP